MKIVRKKFCKLKGWNFIDFDNSLECQEYALFVEQELEKADELITEKNIEIAMLEKVIRELKGDTNQSDRRNF